MAWTPPTQTEVDSYFDKLNNWNRWGADDRRGTLNLITPDKRRAAMQLGTGGRVVSLARDIHPHPNLDYHVLYPGVRLGSDVAVDYFGMVFHGTGFTHMDALCHVSYRGRLYNGRPFTESLSRDGAAWGALDPWFEGVMTRDVLLDIAANRPEGFVTRGNPVTPADLDAAAERAGMQVKPGDAVVIRSGRALYEANVEPYTSGPRLASTLSVSNGCGSTTWRPFPGICTTNNRWDMATWGLACTWPSLYSGLCLIDNTYPERLVEACAAEGRSEFLYIATPLRLVGGTGCPVQPLAIF